MGIIFLASFHRLKELATNQNWSLVVARRHCTYSGTTPPSVPSSLPWSISDISVGALVLTLGLGLMLIALELVFVLVPVVALV